MSIVTLDHTYGITCHPTQVNTPRLKPSQTPLVIFLWARQSGTQSTYPEGTEGWVNLGGWLHATGPGVEQPCWSRPMC